VRRLLLLLIASVAFAGPLPGDDALFRAEALGEAVGLLHNAFAERLGTRRTLPVCDDPELGSLVARTRSFGEAWHAAVEDARQVAADPTQTARLQAQVRAVTEAGAWHRHHVESSFRGCVPKLESAPGVGSPAFAAAGERRGIAVIGVGGGSICPLGLPARGRPVVIEGPACVSRAGCDCEPVEVEPGAVLVAP